MFRAERIPERIDRPNPSAGADSQRLPVIRYGICSAAYANFLCLRPTERKNLEGMYMKKVVAMMLSLVLVHQDDRESEDRVLPVCGRRSDHDGDRTARGAAQGEAAGKGL